VARKKKRNWKKISIVIISVLILIVIALSYLYSVQTAPIMSENIELKKDNDAKNDIIKEKDTVLNKTVDEIDKLNDSLSNCTKRNEYLEGELETCEISKNNLSGEVGKLNNQINYNEKIEIILNHHAWIMSIMIIFIIPISIKLFDIKIDRKTEFKKIFLVLFVLFLISIFASWLLSFIS